jgi:thiol-disulfide isomerase/thioredoxin
MKIICLFLILCSSLHAQQDYNYEKQRDFYLILLSCQLNGEKVTPSIPEPIKCLCGGTGRSGDGLGPCACSPSCTSCKKLQGPESKQTNQDDDPFSFVLPSIPDLTLFKETFLQSGRSDRILYFTQKSCVNCEKLKPIFQALREKKWSIGIDGENHIQVIDLEEAEEIFKAFGVESTPLLLGVKDYQLTGDSLKYEQIHSPFDVAELISEKVTKSVSKLTSAQLKEFAQDYKGPDTYEVNGAYRTHLQGPNHQFTFDQLSELTDWECFKVHGAHHHGYITSEMILIPPTSSSSNFYKVPSKVQYSQPTQTYRRDCSQGRCRWILNF